MAAQHFYRLGCFFFSVLVQIPEKCWLSTACHDIHGAV